MEDKKPRKIKCLICMDRGFIPYRKKVNGFDYEFIAHCTCPAGTEHIYDGRKCTEHKTDYYVPSVEMFFDKTEIAKNNFSELVGYIGEEKAKAMIS